MTVSVCVAALPPMPATIGMNTASAVTWLIVPSNSATTDAATNAVDEVHAEPRQPLAAAPRTAASPTRSSPDTPARR